MTRLGHVLLLLGWLALACNLSRAFAQSSASAAATTQALEALVAEYRAAVAAYVKPYRDAATDEERERIVLDPAAHPANVFLERFERCAADNGASALALRARFMVLELADELGNEEGKRAIEQAVAALFELYAESRELHRLADWLRFGHAGFDAQWTRRQAEHLKAVSKDPLVRGVAMLAIGEMQWIEARRRDDPRIEVESTATLRAALELLRTVDDPPAAEHAEQIVGLLFKIERLRVGKPCPDIEGRDASGQPFKLSDYRGKIVVLEFWGLW